MNLIEIGKNLIKGPKALWLTSRVYNFVCFNHITGKSGNKIINNGAFLNRTTIKFKGVNNEIVLGEKCYLNKCTIQIYGNENKIVLDNLNVLHNTSLYFEDDKGGIYIGRKSLFCGPCQLNVIEGTNIHIGANCLFSSETEIRTGDSHSVLDLNGKRINCSLDVKVGNHTWVGHRACFLKGSATGTDSIVATGAIVTKDFNENNIVIGGVPGKIVKRGVNWCLERI